MGTLANSDDPDEMQHNAAFHQDLHCLLRLKQSSGTEIHYNLDISTHDPLNYTMDSPLHFVSIRRGIFLRMQRVNVCRPDAASGQDLLVLDLHCKRASLNVILRLSLYL